MIKLNIGNDGKRGGGGGGVINQPNKVELGERKREKRE